MSATFFDLMKYAATGIAAPSMTHFDKMRALSMTGGLSVQSITGVPPITFTGNGKPLVSWSMLGNTQQTGTPSPDNIIMPEFCGVRTGQLIPYPYYQSDGTVKGVTWTTYSDGRVVGTGKTSGGTNFLMAMDLALPDGTYTITVYGAHNGMTLYLRDTTASEFLVNIAPSSSDASQTFTVNQPGVHRLYFNAGYADRDVDIDCYVMLNSGSTALPYEPYGWKIPLTCASQTTPLYLWQVGTVRKIRKLVLTGNESPNITNSTTEEGTKVFSFRFTTIGMTDILDYNKRMRSIPYPFFYSSHFKQKDNEGAYTDIKNGEVGANSIEGDTYNRYIVFGSSVTTTVDDFKSYLAAQYAAGTPVTVWYVLATPETGIVNEPLAKIGDYADELSSTIPIPTVKGANVLTVDTTLPPSSMTITGNIK